MFKKKKTDSFDFWMSYTDLMSGFLVVFIIISIAAYTKYSNLFDRVGNPDELETRFTNLSNEMDIMKSELDSKNRELDSIKGANLKNLIFEYQDVFPKTSSINVEFDSIRGSIKLSRSEPGSCLFPSNSTKFEPELKNYLDDIRKPLVEKTIFLWKKFNCKNVELRIEGHTDPNSISKCGRGSDKSFIENMELSSERANNVYFFLFDSDELTKEEKEFMKKNMISVGYSFSDRVSNDNIKDTKIDDASRRIDFRIISK